MASNVTELFISPRGCRKDCTVHTDQEERMIVFTMALCRSPCTQSNPAFLEEIRQGVAVLQRWTQWLKAPTALAEDMGSIPNTHRVAYNHPNSSFNPQPVRDPVTPSGL